MALPKKGLRKITVDNFRYAWSATGNDGGISLSIAPLDNIGQLLTTGFGYYSEIGNLRKETGELIGYSKYQQFIITPYIVRQVIQLALGKGWNPKDKGHPFTFSSSIDEMVYLKLTNKN